MAAPSETMRVHTCRECCRADEVREHNGDLAALGGVPWGGNGSLRRIFLAAGEFGYRSHQLTPMTQRHPDFFQVLICKVGQDGKADVVLGKARRVLPETELLKPVRNLLHRGSAPG